MSRLFNGSTDLMTYGSLPAAVNVNGAFTLLVVCRILNTNDGVWLSAIETETSAAADSATLGRRSSGNVYVSNATLATGTDTGLDVPWTDSDNWCVIAAGKATGTVAPFNHKIPIGGASNRTTASFGMPNAPSITGGSIKLMGNADPHNGRLAVAAIFDKALTQAEVEGIATAKTTQSIYALTPVWLVDDNDAFASDYMGNANRTAISGTTDDADDPSGWVYGISSGTTVTVPGAGAATASGPQPIVTTLVRPYVAITVA